MSEPSEGPIFELVYEGPADSSEETLRRIKGVFIADLELSVAEVQSILASAPVGIKSGNDHEGLEKHRRALQRAGATVALLQRTAPPPPESDDTRGPTVTLTELVGEDAEMQFEVGLDDLIPPTPTTKSTSGNNRVYELSVDDESAALLEQFKVPDGGPPAPTFDTLSGDTPSASEEEDALVSSPSDKPNGNSAGSTPILPGIATPTKESGSYKLDSFLGYSLDKKSPASAPQRDSAKIDLSSPNPIIDSLALALDAPEVGPSFLQSEAKKSASAPAELPPKADSFGFSLSIEDPPPVESNHAEKPLDDEQDLILSVAELVEKGDGSKATTVHDPGLKDLPAPIEALDKDLRFESGSHPQPPVPPRLFPPKAEGMLDMASSRATPPPKTTPATSSVAKLDSAGPEVEIAAPERSAEELQPKPLAQVVKKNVTPTPSPEPLSSSAVEAPSPTLEAPLQAGKVKGGTRLPFDIIVPIIVGGTLLGVANWFYFAQHTARPAAKNPVQASSTNPGPAALSLPNEDFLPPAPQIPTARPAGSMLFKGSKAQAGVEVVADLEGNPGQVLGGSFTISTAEPPTPPKEDLVRGIFRPPWLYKVEVEHLDFTRDESGAFVGRGPAKTYIDFKGEKRRQIGSVIVRITFPVATTALLAHLEVSHLGDLKEFTSLSTEPAVTIEATNSRNFTYLLRGSVEAPGVKRPIQEALPVPAEVR